MTPEAMRIAIAEAVGWKWSPPFNRRKAMNFLISPKGRACTVWRDGGFGGDPPPDYLNDLNSMHEAEKVLTEDHRAKFAEVLYWMPDIDALHDKSGGPDLAYRIVFRIAHATALQRATAFCKTLGIYKEEDKP
jgi:hypothetical protein